MNPHSALQYLKFRLHAYKKHEVFPLSVSIFVDKVLKAIYSSPKEIEIEDCRKRLLSSKETIQLIDFGVGSKNNSATTHLSKRAKRSLKPMKQAQLLANLSKWMQASAMVELGTSFGITSMYLADASPKSKFYTLEGDPESCRIAKENFQHLAYDKINLLEGEFSTHLVDLAKKIKGKRSLIYIDGNHKGEALLAYYLHFKSVVHKDSIFVFDDIYWSPTMTQAWNQIIESEKDKQKIDLFHFGILIPRGKAELNKGHFNIPI